MEGLGQWNFIVINVRKIEDNNTEDNIGKHCNFIQNKRLRGHFLYLL